MNDEGIIERPHAYRPGALGYAIENFVRQHADGLTHERGLENWYRILRLGTNLATFEGTLSDHQIKALQVIGEWWEGKYSVRQRGKRIAELFIFGRSFVTTKMHGFDPAKEKSFFDQDIEASLYHNALQRLFVLEFIAEEGWEVKKTKNGADLKNSDATFAQLLYDTRSDAVKFASAQRLAWHYARSPTIAPLESPSLFNHDIPAWIDTSPWLSPEEKIGLPYYLWDIKNRMTVETSTFRDQQPNYMCISHTWGRWRKPSKVKLKGVGWLIPENTRFDVTTLPQLLEDADFGLGYIWLDLLCIPQDDSEIAKREIARQTCIFGNSIPCAIWFGPDIPSWEPITRSLAWLCLDYLNSTGWEAGIRINDETLAVERPPLRDPIATPDFMMRLGCVVNHPVGIFRTEENADGTKTHHLPSWFTSLWTLQEVCLRPSMFLLDEKMRAFRARDTEPIMFDQLMAFLSVAQIAHRPDHHLDAFLDDYLVVQTESSGGKWISAENRQQAHDLLYKMHSTETRYARSERGKVIPRGCLEILDLGTKVREIQDVAREPIRIIRLADGRECKRSRAIAIMSVLGCTKWYQAYLQEALVNQVYKEVLILGRYPREFLQEVANRFGASFYSCGLYPGPNSDPEDRLVPENLPSGSLLPFCGTIGNPYGISPVAPFVSADLQVGVTHPSVQSWSIQQDGSVYIPQAAILATQKDLIEGRQYDIWFNIYVTSVLFEEPWQSRRALTLPELLPMLPPELDSIFIVTIEGNETSMGVLMHRFSEKEMVKVGTWYTANTSLWDKSLPSETVDWIVR